MTTLAISKDFVKSTIELKTEDQSGKMDGLQNLIVFENDISDQEREEAKQAGLTIYSFEEVIFKGREAFKNDTVSIN